MVDAAHTKILILGGGFAGVYTAMALEKELHKDARVEIGLISKENYMVFQPMLPEVISGGIGILDTITPIRHARGRVDRSQESHRDHQRRLPAPTVSGRL
jgi:NADH dehydrogenase FAD-containing subunit